MKCPNCGNHATERWADGVITCMSCGHKWNEISKSEVLDALELLVDWAEGIVRYGTVKGVALMPLENAKAALKKARGE